MTWVIVFCSFLGVFCLIVGILIGMAWESRLADRAEDEAREGVEEIDRQDAEVMDRFEPIRAAARNAWAIQQARAAEGYSTYAHAAFSGAIDPEQAHEAWLAHSEQALALANGVTLAPEDEAALAAINGKLDRWLAENVYQTEES